MPKPCRRSIGCGCTLSLSHLSTPLSPFAAFQVPRPRPLVTIAWKVGGSRQMHRSLLVPAQYHLALPMLPNSIGFDIYTRHTAYGCVALLRFAFERKIWHSIFFCSKANSKIISRRLLLRRPASPRRSRRNSHSTVLPHYLGWNI